MRAWSFILVAIAIATGVVGLAVYQADDAQRQVFEAESIAYHRHRPAPRADVDPIDMLAYKPAEVREGEILVPRVFLAGLPERIPEARSARERKRLFVATLLPLVLRSNELIAQERRQLLSLMKRIEEGENLDPAATDWLVGLAARYGLKKVATVEDIDFATLLRRVDTIPVSLAIAQAAIESGWGTSRFAQEGNALFGQWTWSDNHKGIVPLEREEGKIHRIRAFDFLIDSVRGYMANLNRNSAYREFRRVRAELRGDGKPVTGLALAGTLTRYSERGPDYVRDLRLIIRTNRLSEFATARLAPEGALMARNMSDADVT